LPILDLEQWNGPDRRFAGTVLIDKVTNLRQSLFAHLHGGKMDTSRLACPGLSPRTASRLSSAHGVTAPPKEKTAI
jgi:hypothetical protein